MGMMNRHGLVAGATGTGKTKTLQLMAEQLSAAGVAVFAADVKGDLSGISQPGESSDKLLAGPRRSARTGPGPGSRPSSTRSAAGDRDPDPGHDTSFGPVLLSKVLGLNDVQESSLGLIFHYRRQGRADAARPEGPALGHPAPHLRRGARTT